MVDRCVFDLLMLFYQPPRENFPVLFFILNQARQFRWIHVVGTSV
jgi:hypothetical protein